MTSDEAYPDVAYGWGNITRETMMDMSERAQAKRKMMATEVEDYPAMKKLRATMAPIEAANQRAVVEGQKRADAHKAHVEKLVREAFEFTPNPVFREGYEHLDPRVPEKRRGASYSYIPPLVAVDDLPQLWPAGDGMGEEERKRVQAEIDEAYEKRKAYGDMLATSVKCVYWVAGGERPVAEMRYSHGEACPQLGDIWLAPNGEKYNVVKRLWKGPILHYQVERETVSLEKYEYTDGLGNKTSFI